MAPGTHALISWWVANARPLSRRDRLLVFVAGVLPDLDGLPLLVSLEAYLRWHHVLCHNLPTGIIGAGLVALLARERGPAVALALISFHLHLACDYFGSGGPDGDVWPLPYLYPAVGSARGGELVGPAWYWNRWQWPLDAWPNFLVALAGVAGWIYIAVRLDRTWFEAVWPGLDREMCRVLRKCFGGQARAGWSPREALVIKHSLIGACVAVLWACVLAGYSSSGPGPP